MGDARKLINLDTSVQVDPTEAKRVLPGPCGLPPVLTLLGLGKRLVHSRLTHGV